jgi:hypothetical protein
MQARFRCANLRLGPAASSVEGMIGQLVQMRQRDESRQAFDRSFNQRACGTKMRCVVLSRERVAHARCVPSGVNERRLFESGGALDRAFVDGQLLTKGDVLKGELRSILQNEVEHLEQSGEVRHPSMMTQSLLDA